MSIIRYIKSRFYNSKSLYQTKHYKITTRVILSVKQQDKISIYFTTRSYFYPELF